MVRSVTGMKKKKTRNPLIRRIPRELAGDWKKYLVVCLFLVLTIGFVSGMYVANESMLQAADEGITKYKREDGHFELAEKADDTLLSDIAKGEPLKTDDTDDTDDTEQCERCERCEQFRLRYMRIFSGMKRKIIITMRKRMERSAYLPEQKM